MKNQRLVEALEEMDRASLLARAALSVSGSANPSAYWSAIWSSRFSSRSANWFPSYSAYYSAQINKDRVLDILKDKLYMKENLK